MEEVLVKINGITLKKGNDLANPDRKYLGARSFA